MIRSSTCLQLHIKFQAAGSASPVSRELCSICSGAAGSKPLPRPTDGSGSARTGAEKAAQGRKRRSWAVLGATAGLSSPLSCGPSRSSRRSRSGRAEPARHGANTVWQAGSKGPVFRRSPLRSNPARLFFGPIAPPLYFVPGVGKTTVFKTEAEKQGGVYLTVRLTAIKNSLVSAPSMSAPTFELKVASPERSRSASPRSSDSVWASHPRFAKTNASRLALWKPPQSWKSAPTRIPTRYLEKPRQKRSAFPPFPQCRLRVSF